MALTAYQRKRNFKNTPEPRGERARKRERSSVSFVIQKHDASRLHYDFRLELDGVLKSWAVPKGPSLNPADKRLAVEVEDHPLEYGSFEGTIPKGQYGGGSVLLWDRGTWTPHEDARKALARGRLKFDLDGEKLQGAWMLVRMHGADNEKNWLLIKERDEHARKGREADIVTERPESVASGREIGEIGNGKVSRSKAKTGKSNGVATKPERVWNSSRPAAKPRAKSQPKATTDPKALPGARRAALPAKVAPQLATLVSEAPEGDDWLSEIKYDGYRLICRVQRGKVSLFTRTGNDWSDRFPEVVQAAAALPVRQALLDGEVVVMKPDGSTSFQALQQALHESGGHSLVYFAFDLLHLDGLDLTEVPLEARKQALADVLAGMPKGADTIRFSDHVIGKGPEFFEAACKHHLEGVICKRRDSAYASARTRAWVKVKCIARQEVVIGGFTEPSGSRSGLGALLLGEYDGEGKLRYCGRVGTGFSHELLRTLRKQLDGLKVAQSPFANGPKPSRGVHWVKPKLVAEVSFTERTQEGMMRHPSFQGLREDKPARQAVREQPLAPRAARRSASAKPARGKAPARAAVPRARAAKAAKAAEGESTVADVTITHPDRVLFRDPALTKLDVARYIEAVAEWMVPQVAGRPLMLLRCPQGQGGQCFYQKHPSETTHRSLDRIPIRDSSGRGTYVAVHDATGLVALVQGGALELHVWGAHSDQVEKPDRMVFDLDPDPTVAWPRVIQAALAIRGLLQRFELESFVKTTGGKGLHVVVPLRRGPDWEDVKVFSSAIASSLLRSDPDGFTTHLSKARRRNRILIDTLRNRRGATWVAPYSPRAREGAMVSMPIEWSQVTARLRPGQFTVASAARLASARKDPWAKIDSLRQTITATMLRTARKASEDSKPA